MTVRVHETESSGSRDYEPTPDIIRARYGEREGADRVVGVANCQNGHAVEAGHAFCPQCGAPAEVRPGPPSGGTVPESGMVQSGTTVVTVDRSSGSLRALMPVLVFIPAVLLIVGAAIKPWAKLSFPNGDNLNIEAYGVQPWSGLAIAAGIAALVFVLYWAVFRLAPVWLAVLVLVSTLGILAASVNTVKTHDVMTSAATGYTATNGSGLDCLQTGDCSVSYGPAPAVALVGGSLLLIVSLVPVLAEQARRASRRRRVQ